MIHCLCYLFCLLSLTLIGIALRDFCPVFWLQYRRRNRLSQISLDDYYVKVLHRAVSMLRRGRSFRIGQSKRLRIIDDIRAILFYKQESSFFWPDAWLAKGICLTDRGNNSGNAIEVLKKYYYRFITDEGCLRNPICHLDQTMHGEPLLYLYKKTRQSHYLRAAEQMADYLMDRGRREGQILYRSANPLCFVDSLGMICPFLTEYGVLSRKREFVEMGVLQLKNYFQHGLEARSGLPFQAYNGDKNNIPVGVVGWGRGAGWYAVGLVDTLSNLDRNDPVFETLRLKAVEFVSAIAPLARQDGGWNGVLTCESPFDSSTSSMLAYFLQRMRLMGLIGSAQDGFIDKAYSILQGYTWADGTLDYAQSNCDGIGRISGIYEPAIFGQGMLLAFLSTKSSIQKMLNE